MPFFKADDIQLWTAGRWTNLDVNKKPEIHGFSIDSRNMEKDFAFVAIKGERDGHNYAQDAVKNGATAIIAERELDVGVPVLVVGNPKKSLQRIAKLHRLRFENPVVGITGSCGKTSTKEMLAKLLSWKNPLYTEKNLNNELGVPLTLTRIDLRQNQLAIIEAGVGAPKQMQELAEMIEPDIAIITNVGLAHMERFIEVGNVAKEKSVLAANVAPDGWCLIHHNLLSWKTFDDLKCKKAVLASSDAPDFKADLIFRYATAETEDGMIGIDMCVEGGCEYYFEVPQMSAGMLDNTLLAIAASLMLGAKEEQLATKLETLAPLPMRGGIVGVGESKYYVDCYNASPTSMKDALAFFAKVSKDISKKLYVLGSMAELGLATHRHHREIATHIKPSENTFAILVGENAEIYKSGLLEGGWNDESIKVYAKAEEAKKDIEAFEGFIFVKGSRVCELEKSLPDEVLSIITNTPITVEVDEEESEIEESIPSQNQNDDDDDDGDEFENLEDDDIDDDDDYDDDTNESDDDDDDDERERI